MTTDTPVLSPAELAALAQEVAVALGEEWRFVADEDHARIERADGAGFTLSVPYTMPTRLAVSGRWPATAKRETIYPSCLRLAAKEAHSTLTATTDAAKVAQAIRRRFLPVYLEQWAVCRAHVERQDAWHAGKRALMARLAEALPGLSVYSEDTRAHWSFRLGERAMDIEFAPYGEGTLEMKIRSVTAEEALTMLEVLRGQEPRLPHESAQADAVAGENEEHERAKEARNDG